MRRKRKPAARRFTTGAVLLSLLLLERAASAVTVQMQANKSSINLADTIDVHVAVQGGTEQIDPPPLEGEGFQVLSSGSQQSIQIINGRQSSTLVFTYRLRPTRAGTLRIPPVKVQIGGQTYQSNRGVTVEVQQIARIDDFFLELESSAKALYLQQEFTVTLKIYARRLSGSYADADPFASQGGTWPQLNIPWLEEMEGFDADPPKQYLESLHPNDRGSGFPINNYRWREFLNEYPFLFPLPRSTAARKASGGKEYGYFVYTLEKRFRAAKLGAFEFAPAVARGVIFVDGGARPQPREFVALSESLPVTVKDVPGDGRPATYTGAIGQFTISASVARDKAFVGEPMTLSLQVAGEGKLEAIAPIPLKIQKQLAEDFRIHEEPETGAIDKKTRTKTFTYGIRPNKAGIAAIPPIEFSYFDPREEKFVTIQTAEVPIIVEAGKTIGSTDVVSGAEAPAARINKAVERALYPNYIEPEALIARAPESRLGWPRLWLLAGPPAVYLVLLLVTWRRRRLAADPRIRRSRGAARKAHVSLKEAEAACRQGKYLEAYQAVHQAITQLIADRLDLPAAGMTPREAMEALARKKIAAEAHGRMAALLTACDQARYGLAAQEEAAVHQAILAARSLLKELEPCLH
ncbi:MAG: protein BatD [Planctomycetes bacterium]|nr:protein BatD [Planctomycetota bacterium]